MRGSVRTVKTFASIKEILAIGHADAAGEHRGQRRNRRTALQVTAIAPAILRGESSLKLTLPKETHFMDATTKTALVIAFVVVALLLLLFGGGMATGTMFSGGMMGSGSMDGISWMWLPILLVVALGVALFSALRFSRSSPEKSKVSSRTAGSHGNVGRRGRVAMCSRQALATGTRQ